MRPIPYAMTQLAEVTLAPRPSIIQPINECSIDELCWMLQPLLLSESEWTITMHEGEPRPMLQGPLGPEVWQA